MRSFKCGRALALITILLVLGMPAAPSRAAEPRQRFLTAPYADASSQGSCLHAEPLGSTCEVEHAADAATGSMVTDIMIRSPEGEVPLPAVAVASADAQITAIDPRAAQVGALLYAVTLDASDFEIGSAIALASGIDASISVTHGSCATCKGGTVETFAPETTFPHTLLAVLSNHAGGSVPPGDVTVTVRVGAEFIGVVLGEVRLALRGTLTQIEAASPSLERILTPPYLEADGSRSCTGDIGMTYSCRAAAARTTGRGEFDLEVISPVAGTAPGSGRAGGTLDFKVDGIPQEPARAVVYVLELDVSQADAYAHQPTPLIGSASAAIDARAVIQHAVCLSCDLSADAHLVDHVDPAFLLDEQIPFVVSMTDPGAGRVPAIVTLSVDGQAVLDDSAGTALATLRAGLGFVRVLEIG